MLQEFKKFALRGNVIDLAIGIVIGTAFGKIVSSLVNDIIMPPLGMLMGGINFSSIKIPLKHAVTDDAGKTISEAVTLNIGSFIQISIDFLIIAFSLFLVIRVINKLTEKKKEESKPAAPPQDVVLLTEIRDLLKK